MLKIQIAKSVAAAPCIPFAADGSGHRMQPSQRVLEIAAMFGLRIDAQREITIVPPCEIPLPFPNRGIVFITGPSGGGKSTILRLLAARCRESGQRVLDLNDLSEPADWPLIELIHADRCLESASSLLSLVGLGDAFVMLRRPSELSDGQRYRFKLARLMELAERRTDYDEQPFKAGGGLEVGESARAGAIIVADEFGATLDRLTARAIASNIRRWISRGSCEAHTLVCATTHDGLLDALQPDVLIVKGFGDQVEVVSCAAACGFAHFLESIRSRTTDNLHLECGSVSDYDRLAQFHYKSGRPGVVKDVFRIVHRAPSIVGRYLNRRNDEEQVVGVLVRSLPSLSCRMRDVATNDRYGGLRQRDAAIMLNREVRTISRVVIDPQWRGVGLAVRLVRHALENPEPGTVFTEALAAMGRVSPFFEHAGMARYDRPLLRGRQAHARLIDALESLSISPPMLGCDAIISSKLESCDATRHAWLLGELRRWHRAAHRTATAKLNAMSLRDLLHAARDELVCQPVYYVFRHGSASDRPAPTAVFPKPDFSTTS